MSQIVACRTDTGIILAADSNAFDVNLKNEIFEVKINRIAATLLSNRFDCLTCFY